MYYYVHMRNTTRELIRKVSAGIAITSGVLTIKDHFQKESLNKLLEQKNELERKSLDLQNRCKDLEADNQRLQAIDSQRQSELANVSKELDSSTQDFVNNKNILDNILPNGNAEEIKTSLDNLQKAMETHSSILDKINSIFSPLLNNCCLHDCGNNCWHKPQATIVEWSGLWKNWNSNYVGEDIINIISTSIAEYKKFLSYLSPEQVGALAHILLTIGMLLCLYPVVAILFGDYILSLFKIEERYPRLWK